MTKDELLQNLTTIGTTEDEVERRSLITSISGEVSGLYDTNETLTASNAKFEADNKKLKEYNMELFLRVGGQKKEKEIPEEKGEKLTYENLFNEKGELK